MSAPVPTPSAALLAALKRLERARWAAWRWYPDVAVHPRWSRAYRISLNMSQGYERRAALLAAEVRRVADEHPCDYICQP